MVGLIAFAFTAGMVATVNPCGFAMVPAYVSMFLTDGETEAPKAAVMRGLRVGGWVTAGFLAAFSVVGVITAVASQRLLAVIPWAAILIGAGLVGLGVAVLSGVHLSVRSVNLRFSKDGSVRSMVLFGVAYGIASVSCTLPVFLAVASQALAAPSVLGGVSVLTAYGLGMGAVLIALAVALAASNDLFVRRLRRVMPHMERIGGWLLVASGLYLMYYWAVSLAVPLEADSFWRIPFRVVEAASEGISRSFSAAPLLWLVGLGLVVAVIIAAEIRRSGRSLRDSERT